jgi:hypothetical protein
VSRPIGSVHNVAIRRRSETCWQKSRLLQVKQSPNEATSPPKRWRRVSQPGNLPCREEKESTTPETPRKPAAAAETRLTNPGGHARPATAPPRARRQDSRSLRQAREPSWRHAASLARALAAVVALFDRCCVQSVSALSHARERANRR